MASQNSAKDMAQGKQGAVDTTHKQRDQALTPLPLVIPAKTTENVKTLEVDNTATDSTNITSLFMNTPISSGSEDNAMISKKAYELKQTDSQNNAMKSQNLETDEMVLIKGDTHTSLKSKHRKRVYYKKVNINKYIVTYRPSLAQKKRIADHEAIKVLKESKSRSSRIDIKPSRAQEMLAQPTDAKLKRSGEQIIATEKDTVTKQSTESIAESEYSGMASQINQPSGVLKLFEYARPSSVARSRRPQSDDKESEKYGQSTSGTKQSRTSPATELEESEEETLFKESVPNQSIVSITESKKNAHEISQFYKSLNEKEAIEFKESRPEPKNPRAQRRFKELVAPDGEVKARRWSVGRSYSSRINTESASDEPYNDIRRWSVTRYRSPLINKDNETKRTNKSISVPEKYGKPSFSKESHTRNDKAENIRHGVKPEHEKIGNTSGFKELDADPGPPQSDKDYDKSREGILEQEKNIRVSRPYYDEPRSLQSDETYSEEPIVRGQEEGKEYKKPAHQPGDQNFM